jgi:hypothetical protein
VQPGCAWSKFCEPLRCREKLGIHRQGFGGGRFRKGQDFHGALPLLDPGLLGPCPCSCCRGPPTYVSLDPAPAPAGSTQLRKLGPGFFRLRSKNRGRVTSSHYSPPAFCRASSSAVRLRCRSFSARVAGSVASDLSETNRWVG